MNGSFDGIDNGYLFGGAEKDGARESAQDWRELLLDLKRRGLTSAPQFAIADGGLDF